MRRRRPTRRRSSDGTPSNRNNLPIRAGEVGREVGLLQGPLPCSRRLATIFDLDPSPKSPQAKKRALETAAAITEQLREGKLGAAISRTPKGRARERVEATGEGEFVSTYADRWFDACAAAG